MITKAMFVSKDYNPPRSLAFKIASAQVSLQVFANKIESTIYIYRYIHNCKTAQKRFWFFSCSLLQIHEYHSPFHFQPKEVH